MRLFTPMLWLCAWLLPALCAGAVARETDPAPRPAAVPARPEPPRAAAAADTAFARRWDRAFELLRGAGKDPDVQWAEDGPPVVRRSGALPLSAMTNANNVRINDPTGDDPAEVQSETAAASLGLKIIAGYNDSRGFATGSVSSFAYSSDGGLTWGDGGDLPLQGLGTGEDIHGDPGLCVNRKGHWWYGSDYFQPGDISAIGVLRGDFSGPSPVWTPPVAVQPTVPDFLDKSQIACDRDSDYVYIAYTRYLGSGGSQMEFARSLDGGSTWSPAFVLQPMQPGDDVIGAWLVVDEAGGVNVFWEDLYGAPIGTGVHSRILHRRSVDLGLTFFPIDTAAVVHQNWYAAPPAFNRRDGFYEFPSATVDLSAGPNRGMLYLTWNEAADPLLSAPAAPGGEIEPNNTPAQATPIAIQSTIAASINFAGDVDYYQFSGSAGQMVRLYCTPQSTLSPWLRLSNAPAADTFIVDSRNGTGRPAFGWVTLPSSGTYTVDLRSIGNTQGTYTLQLQTVTPRAGSVGRDHRDIAVTVSHDHGAHWSLPRLVNDDPPFFDNCMPFVSVDTLGQAQIFWYDRRNDPVRGGRADLYYARSSDGGATWSPNVRLTDGATTWQVPARSAPNFGDYSSSTATGNLTLPFFADGRFGNPDVFTSPVRSGFLIACAADTLLLPGDTLTARYQVTNFSGFPETFRYDITDSAGLLSPAHDSLFLAPFGSGQVVCKRAAPMVLPGNVNDSLTMKGFYRSAAFAAQTCRSTVFFRTSPAAVAGPGPFENHLAAPWPSPSAGAVHVSFGLARPGPVRIAVYDMAGRRVAQVVAGPRPAGPSTATWDGRGATGERAAAGVYVVRAQLPGTTLTRRVVLLH